MSEPFSAASWEWLLEWLRAAGGILGLVVGGIGMWVYMRVAFKQRTEQAQTRVLTIRKDQIDALEARMGTMDEDYKRQKVQADEREKELITLRARTDLSEVLRSSQLMTQALTDLIAEARTHDNTISVVLRDAMSTGATQYQELMGLNNQILTHLSDTSKQGLDQSIKNYGIMERVVKSLDNLSRRMGKVEGAVDAVADQVGVETPTDEKEPDGRRRKDSR